jgi:menaquinone-dependent protoporphyrinogen oxidase
MARARISRRALLLAVGGTLGACALTGMGAAIAGSARPAVSFVDTTFGEVSAMEQRLLVAYASQAGTTGDVADAIGKQLAAGGIAVDVRPVKDVKDLSAYSAVVIGSAIHGGKWLPEAIRFVEDNRARLNQLPTAYFLACMMVVNLDKNLHYVEQYLESMRTLVKPVAEGRFAGALLLNRYSFVEGIGLRIFLASQKLAAGDYRDWDAIAAWADSTRPLLLR